MSLGSIKAGNSSIKLKNQVLSLLDSLVELGTVNKKQKKKIISNYILQKCALIFCLTRVSHTTMLVHNIDAFYDNNKIRWRKKTEEWQTLTFPNGMYDYKRINTFLQKHIGKVDPADKDSDYIFSMYFDVSIYRVVISMHENYELDFSQGAFAELLDYEKKILTGKTSHVGKFVPNVTRGVDWVYLHCDLITRRTNNVPSDVLYSFSTTGLQVSYPFQKEPRRLEWHPVNKSYINEIRVWVTDGRNNIVDLNGTDIAISLMLEKE